MIERFSRLLPLRWNPWSPSTGNTRHRLPLYSVGAPNLEVLKFGMYIMFPIGWMYYFGTNLENRFSVPDFWPTPEETNKIPFEKEDQKELAEKLKTARLERRRKRLEAEERMGDIDALVESKEGSSAVSQDLMATSSEPMEAQNRSTPHLGLIDRWASGKR